MPKIDDEQVMAEVFRYVGAVIGLVYPDGDRYGWCTRAGRWGFAETALAAKLAMSRAVQTDTTAERLLPCVVHGHDYPETGHRVTATLEYLDCRRCGQRYIKDTGND